MAVPCCQCAKCKPGAKYYNCLFPPQHLNRRRFLTTGEGDGSSWLCMGMMRTAMTTAGASHVAQTIVPHLLADVVGALCPSLTEGTPLPYSCPALAWHCSSPHSCQFSYWKSQLTAVVLHSPAHHCVSCGKSQ